MTKGNVRECNCGVTCFNCPLTAETWLETTGLNNKGIFKEINMILGSLRRSNQSPWNNVWVGWGCVEALRILPVGTCCLVLWVLRRARPRFFLSITERRKGSLMSSTGAGAISPK